MTKRRIKLSDIVLEGFDDFWEAARLQKYLFIVCEGGRNSAKSSHVALRVITDMMKKDVNALCIRKVGNTLETSMYEQLKWAIEILGVGAYWKANLSPLKLTYVPTGNVILFRGADDPAKIKSIKTSKFPIAILWVEELSEFKTEDELNTLVNSIVRAELPDGLKYQIYYSYNPPKRKSSWVNKRFGGHKIPKNTFVHHSNYLGNKHCSKAFLEEAEEAKSRNLLKYEHEYLGKQIGSGVVPFNNLVFRRITDEEVESFDNIRQGLDWGYAADPLAFVRLHYDKTRRRLYFISEVYGVKLSNREAAIKITELEANRELTIADSAEPKSVSEMKERGVRCKSAKKGPGSVEYGEKWLDDLVEIVIDPQRTPNAAKEFEAIDYQVDQDGNVRSKLMDKDNHTIDATRYAMEGDMKRGVQMV